MPSVNSGQGNNLGNNLNNAGAAASPDSIQSASSENRLRWIDYRNRPAYPPRMPPVHGIPSGFRNPTASQPTLPNVAAAATANSGLLGPVISASPANAAGPSSIHNSIAPASSSSSISNNNGAAYLNSGMHPIGLNPIVPNGLPIPNNGNNAVSSQMNPNSMSAINGLSNSLNFASIVNSLAVPNMHTPPFGGSSSNPVGFAYPNANNMPSISNGIMGPNSGIGGSISTSAADLEAEIEAGLISATHSFSRRPGVNITRVERK